STTTATPIPTNDTTFFAELTTPGMLTGLSIILLMMAILAVGLVSLAGIATPTGLERPAPSEAKKKFQ
ncbi:hypothetical protein IWQ61_007738, partial [Dispira simplex]